MAARRLGFTTLSSVAIGLAASQHRLRFAVNEPSAATTSSSTSSSTTKDPKDCKEAACRSKVDDLKASFGKAGVGAVAGNSDWKKASEEPPSREVLGRAGWTVLHCFAAYYPDEPTEDEKRMALAFLEAFSHLYPCKDCAEGLRVAMETSPPRVESRKEFSLWVCETHNHVNEQIGKATTPCDLAALDKRWRGK